ncbi:enoyl-CoA hydratase/isomerase family protein [Demetria terragena]|uniref:enoyl-CoA hydratase/isomerase family protein n=1 Tax=Demetria terragena TaxID=63959 RepID=UPI00037CEE35|nr:enoyl-CoA hydratase/isomerase family protein [Demetria terragena]
MTAEECGIKVVDSDGVRDITLDRPRQRNALDLTMLDALRDALVARPDDVSAIVLHGGDFFCAGANIKVYSAGSLAASHRLTMAAAATTEALATVPVPVIAAVEGMALGGGFEIVLACDLVVMGQTAQLGLPEITLGLVPGWGGTQRLAAQIGARRAKRVAMFDERIDAATALAWGLVNETVDDGSALSRSHELAGNLTARSTTALAALKRLCGSVEADLKLAEERSTLRELLMSTDGQEGIAAFVEKRKPRFGDSRDLRQER